MFLVLLYVLFVVCYKNKFLLLKLRPVATSDWVIGCLVLAEDWTERVPLDQRFREAVSRVGLCITGMGEL